MVCGVAVPAGGVAVLDGGVAVFAGGVAGDPGVVVCPALPLEVLPEPGDVPAAGELCAMAQLAQPNTTENNINFFVDMKSLRMLFGLSARPTSRNL